jgi:trehalose/maltose hydrolase-like predicted phosphorylase
MCLRKLLILGEPGGEDDSYSILNVVGADEYAQHVDDNAFTNASVESLRNTVKAAKILNEPINPLC